MNEVQINVSMTDGTGPEKQKIKAGYEEFANSLPPIEVKASNPINEAYVAEVRAQIQSLEAQSFEIPITADTEEARAEVEAAIAELQTKAALYVDFQAGNVEEFNAEVLGDVEALRARIGALVVPVQAESGPAAVPSAVGYAGAVPRMAEIEAQQQLTVPVKATNPIDDAWIAQVKASLRSVANEALSIPVNPELADFEAQLEATLTQLAATSKLDVPVDVGDAMVFREEVQQLVQQVENSVQAVIRVKVDNEGALTDLQQKTAAAAQADLELVEAQAKLNQATAAGNDEAIVKARDGVVAATKADAAATQELREAQAAAGQEVRGLAAAEDVAAGSARGLGAAMGPLWMVMNAAQITMMGFGFSSSTTANQVQDVSQQIIQMGQSTGQSLASLVGGNDNLQKMGDSLTKVGSSGAEFSRAFSTGLPAATAYTQKFADEYSSLGTTMLKANDVGVSAAQKLDLVGARGGDASISIKDLATAVNQHNVSMSALPPAVQDAVNRYNDLTDVTGQTQNALKALKAEVQGEQQVLASLGYTMSDGQQAAESYGLGIAVAAKALADAQAGSKYLEDSTDKATISAGQAVQQWQQLQQAVTNAQQSYQQAAQGVASAEHGVETASQGVASAIHSEQQAVLAVQQAQQGYTNSLYQEQQAQQAVTAARQAAEQQLISLQLQANDAAESVNSANLSLFNAQQNASKYGVNSGNADQIAGTQDITAANQAQVQAAQQLVAAENALADAQNSSSNAQSGLNTARQQGVDGNPAVLSAEHSLTQAQDGVAQAAQGVTNAQYAQQQAALQVTNAEWSLQAASLAVGQAQNAETNAANALTTAQGNVSRSTDASTLVGAQNRQMLVNQFYAYQDMTGNAQIAAQMTQTFGQQMHISAQHVSEVLDSLQGLNGQSATFFVTGTPSIDPRQLVQIGNDLGLDFATIEAKLPTQRGTGRAYAAGGTAGGGMALVGEHGPEIVHLAPGSTVMPHANTMAMLKGYASGGAVGALDNPMSALQANIPLVGQWAGLDAVGQALHAMGGPAVQLPPAGQVDLGPFGFGGGAGGGSVGPGHGGASSAVAAAAQAYAQSQLASHGWGLDQMQPLIWLWNQESGWNPWAVNPSSGAYGIPQSLGHGHPYDLGAYMPQVDWGEDYIAGRYGSPSAAWAHEKAFNWYAAGGSASGGLAVVGEHGPELVSSGGGSVATAQNVQVDVTLSAAAGGDQGLATLIMYLVRTNKIQLSVTNKDGTRSAVKVG